MRKGSRVIGSIADRVRQRPDLSHVELAALIGVTPSRVAVCRYHDAHRDEIRTRRRELARQRRAANKRTFEAFEQREL